MTDDLTQIVHLVRQQDPTAVAWLVQRYQQPALRAAQNILGNRADAEDAVQDAWLLALHRVATLREPAQFGGWFYRIVANLALRRRQQRAAQPATLELLESLQQPSDEQLEPAYQALLPLAMQALSTKEQIVITLHYFSGVSVAQVATLLDLPQGTIKSRLHHARQLLRKELLTMANQTSTRPAHIPADFRQTIAGMRGRIEWQSIFSGDLTGWEAAGKAIPAGTVPAHWTVVGKDGLVGEHWQQDTSLTYGAPEWRDVELSLLVTPLAGGNAQILFRADRAHHGCYLCDLLMGWQAIAVSRVTFDAQGNSELTRLSVVDYPLVHQREYALSIAARGHSITTYIDGALVNQVTDSAWLHGQIGLNVWQSKTLYRDIRVRLLE